MDNKYYLVKRLKLFRMVFCFVVLIVLIMIGYARLDLFFINAINREDIPRALHDMKIISHALRSFVRSNDVYPYDSRGSKYALYKLKPHLSRFPDSIPKEYWDDENEMLSVLPYDYLNAANLTPYVDFSNPSNIVIIMAERVKPNIKGINLIVQNGAVLWYQPSEGSILDIGVIIGRSMADIKRTHDE